MNKWSVAIADDNERMVEILQGIVHQDEEFQIVGIARNGDCLLYTSDAADD